MDKKKFLKSVLTSGLMLVGTLVSTGNVNADEVKPDVDNETNTKEPTFTVTQDTKQIDEAVEKAKKVEVEVTKTENKVEVSSKEEADKFNEEKQKELDLKAKEINEAVEKYKVEKAEEEKKIKEVESQPLIAEKDNVTVRGEYNEAGEGSLDYYKNIKVIAKQSEIGTENLSTPFSWTPETVVEAVKDVDISKEKDSYYTFKNYKEGSQFYIRNVATGETKGILDLLVTIGKVEKAGKVSENWFSLFKGQNHDTINSSFYAQKYLSLDFETLDKQGKPVSTIQTFVVSDVDYNQGSKLTFEHNVATLIPPKSGLVDNGEQIKDVEGMVLEDYASTPRGTYAVVGYGSKFNYTHYANHGFTGEAFDEWFKNASDSGTAFAMFGNGYSLEVLGTLVKPELNYEITKYIVKPKVSPEKHNYNESGVIIDGQMVFAGSINNYKLTWSLNGYKGLKLPNNEIKDFYYIDDYPEEALEVLDGKATVTDLDGNKVDGIDIKVYKSVDELPEDVKKIIADNKLNIKGALQVFKVLNSVEFFEKYVATGKDLVITSPMKVKAEMGLTGGLYENVAYQVDFGVAKATKVVVNNVPKPNVPEEPIKPNQPNVPELPNTGTETLVLSNALGGLSLALGGLVLKGKKKD